MQDTNVGPVTPTPGQAPSTTASSSRNKTIIIVVVVAAVLLLCCCLAIAGLVGLQAISQSSPKW